MPEFDIVKFSKHGRWHRVDCNYENEYTETDCLLDTDMTHEYRHVPDGWPLTGRKCRECFPKEAHDA